MSQKKYLDLAGLTAYDTKIKAWHQKHVQDISDNEILALFTTGDGYTLVSLKKVDISGISYEEVDLGLPSGRKWANKNIGAQTENDYGTYFSWGNTEGYTVSGTKFLTVDEACQLFNSATGQTVSTKEELEKMLSQFGITVDNLGVVDGYSYDKNTYATTPGGQYSGSVLDAEHDAATHNMSDGWRMPTFDEYKELVNAVKTEEGDSTNPLICQYEYLDLDGQRQTLTVYRDDTDCFNVSGLIDDNYETLFKWIYGVRFKNVNTGASVLFPACGSVNGSVLPSIGFHGYYWSSSIIGTTSACGSTFSPDGVFTGSSDYRYNGLCVRAVK